MRGRLDQANIVVRVVQWSAGTRDTHFIHLRFECSTYLHVSMFFPVSVRCQVVTPPLLPAVPVLSVPVAAFAAPPDAPPAIYVNRDSMRLTADRKRAPRVL
jgi:hypothetical protein